eukprot:Nk52_evm25s367 gene=Nk52_evmTU25s367
MYFGRKSSNPIVPSVVAISLAFLLISPPLSKVLSKPVSTEPDTPFGQKTGRSIVDEKDISSSSSDGLNVTVYTSGGYANLPAYITTRTAIAQAALLVYARLPTNKTNTNLTYVAEQLDFRQEYTNYCNSSAFSDSCSSLWSMSYLLNMETGTLPLGWTSLVAYLAYKGVDEIYNFSLYGCTGVVSISRFGVSLQTSNVTCPSASSSSTPPSFVSSSQDYSTAGCWSAPYLNGFSINCSALIYGLPEAGMVFGYGSGSLTGLKSSMQNIDSFTDEIDTTLRASLETSPDSFAQDGGAMQQAANSALQYQMGFTDTTNSQVYQSSSAPYAQSLAQLGGQQSFSQHQSSVRAAVVDFLNTQTSAAANDVPGTYFYSQIASMANSLGAVKQSLSEGTYRSPQYFDFVLKTQSSSAYASMALDIVTNCTTVMSDMESAYKEGDWNLLKSLEFGIQNGMVTGSSPYCNLNYSVDAALLSGQNIYNAANVSLTQSGVTTESDTYGPNIGGDIVSPNEVDTQEDLFEIGLAASAAGGLMIELGGAATGAIAGVFLAQAVVSLIVDSAVNEVIDVASQGFEETLNAINEISEMSYDEYSYTISELNDQLGDLEVDEFCQASWSTFETLQANIVVDMELMNSTYTECKLNQNLTGVDYVKCEYEMSSTIPPEHLEYFNQLVNLNPELDWSESVIGSFVLDCSKYQAVYNGLGPTDLSSAMYSMYQTGQQAIYQSGMIMQWYYLTDTLYNAVEFNSTFVNNTDDVLSTISIMQNITSDFTSWFRDEVIPPAIAAHFPSSLWTDFGVDPPSKTRYQIEILDSATFESMGPITPLVWTPYTQSNAEENPKAASTIKQSSLSFFEVQNSGNITESAIEYCATIPCPYQTCTCSVVNSTAIECADNGELCSGTIMVEFTYQTNFPARGWAGPYSENSKTSTLIGQPSGEALRTCTDDDMDSGDLCIPGLYIQNLDGDNVQLYVNGSWGINLVPDDNYERQMLFNSTNPNVTEAMQSGSLMFQMYDALWGWKYGIGTLSDYFGNYFSAYPSITLKSVFNVHNSSDFQEEWQYYWVVSYGEGDNDYYYAYISQAETSFYSSSEFGFSCQENGPESSSDTSCILTEVQVDYPSYPDS